MSNIDAFKCFSTVWWKIISLFSKVLKQQLQLLVTDRLQQVEEEGTLSGCSWEMEEWQRGGGEDLKCPAELSYYRSDSHICILPHAWQVPPSTHSASDGHVEITSGQRIVFYNLWQNVCAALDKKGNIFKVYLKKTQNDCLSVFDSSWAQRQRIKQLKTCWFCQQLWSLSGSSWIKVFNVTQTALWGHRVVKQTRWVMPL